MRQEGPPGEPCGGLAADVNDVDIRGDAREVIQLRNDESAEAVQLSRSVDYRIEVLKKRAPRLQQDLVTHEPVCLR